MKEMVYKKKRNKGNTILDTGYYENYEYLILSLGTHPCAYICLTPDDIFYKKDYDNIDIYCHGGLSFADNCIINILEYSDKYKCDTLQTFNRDWIIGWDYAHYDDYIGYYPNNINVKKWTTQEIKEEVKYVINQLIEKNLKKGDKNDTK